ncbi:MAG: hypothetical protein ACUVS2_13725 [Candidatus Flexifilum sp.]|jgi:hypothetical protein
MPDPGGTCNAAEKRLDRGGPGAAREAVRPAPAIDPFAGACAPDMIRSRNQFGSLARLFLFHFHVHFMHREIF